MVRLVKVVLNVISIASSYAGRVLVIAHRDYLLSLPIRRLMAHGFDDVAVEKADERSEEAAHRCPQPRPPREQQREFTR